MLVDVYLVRPSCSSLLQLGMMFPICANWQTILCFFSAFCLLPSFCCLASSTLVQLVLLNTKLLSRQHPLHWSPGAARRANQFNFPNELDAIKLSRSLRFSCVRFFDSRKFSQSRLQARRWTTPQSFSNKYQFNVSVHTHSTVPTLCVGSAGAGSKCLWEKPTSDPTWEAYSIPLLRASFSLVLEVHGKIVEF